VSFLGTPFLLQVNVRVRPVFTQCWKLEKRYGSPERLRPRYGCQSDLSFLSFRSCEVKDNSLELMIKGDVEIDF
jgi:hypothetical protein